jgi:hypothetical protein
MISVRVLAGLRNYQFLLKFKIFTPPKLKKYDAFAQMI